MRRTVVGNKVLSLEQAERCKVGKEDTSALLHSEMICCLKVTTELAAEEQEKQKMVTWSMFHIPAVSHKQHTSNDRFSFCSI
jgi:hypothetical protein